MIPQQFQLGEGDSMAYKVYLAMQDTIKIEMMPQILHAIESRPRWGQSARQ